MQLAKKALSFRTPPIFTLVLGLCLVCSWAGTDTFLPHQRQLCGFGQSLVLVPVLGGFPGVCDEVPEVVRDVPAKIACIET